ncbi:MAG: DNA translocase FtsK 4TM domain-containing protein, partial [Candidatus Saccharicenans sp.]
MPKDKKERNNKRNQKKDNLLVEVIALIFIFLALFSLISLISYDPADPSWANISPPGHKTHNFGGKIGSYLAESLLQGFGLIALFLPLVFGYLGIKTLFPGQARKLGKRVVMAIVYFFILNPLFFLILDRIPWRGKEFLAGGIVGDLLLGFLVRYLSRTGSFIFLLGLLAAVLLFTTHWSLSKTVHFLSRLFRSTFSQVKIRITEKRR